MFEEGSKSEADSVMLVDAGHWEDQPPSQAEKPKVTYSSLLRNKNFRFLWLGEAFSTFGSLFTRLALPIYIFTITDSYTQLGLSYFFSLVASLIFGLFSGVLIDRWNRKRAMVAANILNGGVLLILLWITLQPFSSFQLASIYVLIFLAAVLRDFFAAARVAIFPDILSDDELLTANALDQATVNFAELFSYPLAAMVLLVGPTLAFGLDAVTFFIAGLLLMRIRISRTRAETTQERNMLQQITTGIQTAWRLHMVRKILILSLIVPCVFSLIFTLQLPYAVDVAGSTKAIGLPMLEGAMAVGFIFGAVMIGRWAKDAARGAMLAYGIGGMGLALALQGALPYFAIHVEIINIEQATGPLTPLLLSSLPALIMLGMTNSLVNTSIRTVVQEQTPRTLLGRVYSVIQVAASVGFASGALLTGLAEGRVPLVLMLLGGALFTIGVFARWWFTSDDHSSTLDHTESQFPSV
jgi:DHA3 family macrolide efflux protein-like MFS transporter